jgi:hypothetical protein
MWVLLILFEIIESSPMHCPKVPCNLIPIADSFEFVFKPIKVKGRPNPCNTNNDMEKLQEQANPFK